MQRKLTAHQNVLLSEWIIKDMFAKTEQKTRMRDELIMHFKHINAHTEELTEKNKTDWEQFELNKNLPKNE